MIIDQSTVNFAVYEDGVEYYGMAKVGMPDISAITQTIAGAGIAGNVEAVVMGHYDTMTLTLNFRNTTPQSITLSEPRRHTIDLRVSQQVEDTAAVQVATRSVKHVMVVIPKAHKMGSVAEATPTDGSGEYAVRYWATYIDGTKVREIDPFNFICEVNGVDYLADVRTDLGK